MSVIYRFTTLDDAYAFLLEAKGLPEVASARPRMQRCVRACILLSWIALEEGLDEALDLWNREGRALGPLPGPLKPRLSAVLAALSRPPIDDSAFTTLRTMRNGLTHPRASVDEPELAVQQAEKTFDFCLATLRVLFPHPVECQF
jgi:hypothetical protein